MEPFEWLNKHFPGFNKLAVEDREVIYQFTLLWSLFEAQALNCDAKVADIENFAKAWAQAEPDNPSALHTLAYFRDRYFPGGQETDYFAGLRLRDRDSSQLVRDVLNGGNNDPGAVRTALLIVVYRFRNNLFHGEKWAYGLQGQRENFKHSNALLMGAMDFKRAQRNF